MRELDPGHLYELDNLKTEGKSYLQFYKDPALHGGSGSGGPSTQEVLRTCIARIKYLDTEVRWWGNGLIIKCLRASILLCEIRALMRKAEKARGVEHLKTGKDGHVS